MCSDIPDGHKKRRKEAAGLDPDAPMRHSDASPADMDVNADADAARGAKLPAARLLETKL